jgi:membrane protein DedA with SNARE-associated domain
MDFQAMVDWTLTTVKANEAWGPPIVLALAFAESLAFVSLLVPATVILFALSALIGTAGLDFWPLWVAAAIGAILGDWVSFWIGQKFGPGIGKVWPLNRHPDLLPHGQALCDKWGMAGVFFGRFLGPLRAAVPLVAGICAMSAMRFQAANISSGLVWATGILAPGAFGFDWLLRAFH